MGEETADSKLMIFIMKVLDDMLNVKTEESFEDLYRHAYSIVKSGHGELLYNTTRAAILEHIEERVIKDTFVGVLAN